MNCVKIQSVRYVGNQQTYNIRMRSRQHNYLTSPDVGQPVHKNSHSCAYILVAYWCAWLKTHFAPEWWAAVMSGCHSDRIPKYMNTARLEGVKFGLIRAESLTRKFSVSPDLEVTPGLTSIKGIGKKAADKLEGKHDYKDIDHFVEINGKAKNVMEPLIKLGAFLRLHKNTKATWMWYQYKYCTGKPITKLKAEIRGMLLADWTDEKIEEERRRQAEEYKKLYPNRKKIPKKIANWKPKADDSRENIMALFEEDFDLKDRLEFEKQYLGYYWHSPLDLYETRGGETIINAKKSENGVSHIECVIEKLIKAKTRTGSAMGRLKVTDGLSDCTIILWSKQLEVLKPYLKEDLGIRVEVSYDPARNTFTLARSTTVPVPLRFKSQYRDNEE